MSKKRARLALMDPPCEEKKRNDDDKDLVEWRNDEQKARREELEQHYATGRRNIGLTRNFFSRNFDRFVYLIRTQTRRPIELADENFGCNILHDVDEDGCPQCGSEFGIFGRLRDMSLEPARIPSCFNPGKLVFKEKRTQVTLLLPVLPGIIFDLDVDPFFIRKELSNPDGITFLDLYRGVQEVLETLLSDPKLNVCIQQILPFLTEGCQKELVIHEADKGKKHGEVVSFLDRDGKPVERLVDVGFYWEREPCSIVAFSAFFTDEAFVVIEYD